ncbi:hypothetical protein DGWBC_0554 [Dehalogenimonas sp. WBC-2]|nr:hypothetical protein DGWBC_0554 [Dehalogenimonas sp. WBC-2]
MNFDYSRCVCAIKLIGQIGEKSTELELKKAGYDATIRFQQG